MQNLNEFTPSILLENVEIFANRVFTNKHNLLLVFTEGLKKQNQESFERLIFTAKYVLGLKRVLEKGAGIPDVNNPENVKKDFSENISLLLEILKEFNKAMPEISKSNFKENFLNVNPDCLSNLYNLLEGLEWTKIYLNDFKRR